jgi:ferredoxin-type protein NapH
MAKTSRWEKWVAWRIWVQAGFLAVWLDPLALRLHQFCGPVFHCYACPLATFACPVGVLANFSALHVFPFAAVGLLLIFGGLFGGFICGWACPFGFVQDLAARIRKPKISLPRWTGHIRYATLILMVLVIPWFFGESHPLFFCQACPAGALEGRIPRMVSQAVASEPIPWPNAIKIVVSLAFIIAIFFIHRPWCRVLCPLGAIFGLFNRVAGLTLKFNIESCTRCGLCQKRCPHGLAPIENAHDTTCIRCLHCTVCPTGALQPGDLAGGAHSKSKTKQPM